jgi:hypothetical protein
VKLSAGTKIRIKKGAIILHRGFEEGDNLNPHEMEEVLERDRDVEVKYHWRTTDRVEIFCNCRWGSNSHVSRCTVDPKDIREAVT